MKLEQKHLSLQARCPRVQARHSKLIDVLLLSLQTMPPLQEHANDVFKEDAQP